MNNYWVTNFKASQQDEFNWSYTLSTENFSENPDASALKKGISERVSLYSRVIPEKKGAKLPMERSLLSIDAPAYIVPTNMSPAAFSKGIILQIRNLGTEKADFSIIGSKGRKMRFRQVNALEEPLGRACRKLSIAPGEDIFVKIK